VCVQISLRNMLRNMIEGFGGYGLRRGSGNGELSRSCARISLLRVLELSRRFSCLLLFLYLFLCPIKFLCQRLCKQ